MFPGGLFLTGVLLALMILLLIFWLLGFVSAATFRLTLWLICIALVVTLLIPSPMPVSSSVAPPACLDGFIVETNGGTSGADTCTHSF